MNEYEIVKLENGIDYLLLTEEIIDGVNYLYLVNTNDENDFVIRKEVNDEYVGLTEEEFDKLINNLIDKVMNE